MATACASAIGAEMKLPIGVRESVEKMTGRERRTAIEPTPVREALDIGQPADLQGPVDQLDGTHRKARMACAEPLGEAADYVVVRAALGIGRQDRAAELQGFLRHDACPLGDGDMDASRLAVNR